jgi:hypothetical protein
VGLWFSERARSGIIEITSGSAIVDVFPDILGVSVPLFLHLSASLERLLLEVLALSELDVGHQASEASEVLVASRAVNILLVGVHL